MTDVRNQRVLITGGSRGIGRLMAGLLAERGAEVVIWGRNPERLVRTVDEIRQRSGRAAAQVCDVADRTSVYAAAAELEARGGPVRVLINNAGIVSGRPLLELTDAQIEQTLRVNVLAHFWTAKAARRVVRAIEKNRPRVVMPPLAYTIPLFRMLPVSVMDATADLLGLNASMETFTGRSESIALPPARPEPPLRVPPRCFEMEEPHASAE